MQQAPNPSATAQPTTVSPSPAATTGLPTQQPLPRAKPTTVFGLRVLSNAGREVNVPVSCIREVTAGSRAYMMRNLTTPPRECKKFVAGLPCVANDCPDVHVDPQYVASVADGCCAYCGDTFSRRVVEDVPELQTLGPFLYHGFTVPVERLCLTAAIPRLVAQQCIDNDICLDHLSPSGCTFGKDCTMLHLCRKRHALISSHTQQLGPSTMGTQTSGVGGE